MTTELDKSPRVNINDEEIKLVKSIFKGNEALLQAIRGVMFGLSLTEGERELVRSAFTSEKLQAIFRKRFLPSLDKNSPIGQVSDAWLGAETMVFGQPPDTVSQALQYKQHAIWMTNAALDALVNPDKKLVYDLAYNYDPSIYSDPLGIKLLARNQFIRHVEQQLLMLKLIAEQPNAGQVGSKALAKDSAK